MSADDEEEVEFPADDETGAEQAPAHLDPVADRDDHRRRVAEAIEHAMNKHADLLARLAT